MSRYVIELRPDCKVVQQICESNGQVSIGAKSSEYLEELNADYVNDHFGILQDDAYNAGFENGKKESYQQGLEDGKAVNDKGCEGCKYKGTIGMPPCIHCCNNFPNAWKKQDDKPIIGEVVERYLNGKRDGVGMFLGEDGDYWNCLFWTGAIFGTFAYPSNQFKRTGNVCDITKILEAMKHD